MKAHQRSLTCAMCGNIFCRRHDRVQEGNNFCALACRVAWFRRHAAETRSRKCGVCGMKFIPRPAQLAQGIGKFCSIPCSIKNVHSLPRTQEWREAISRGNKGRPGKPGATNPAWKGGRFVDSYGYVQVWVAVETYIPEHRLVMEKHLGRELRSDEIVHHLNGVKTDNRIENLLITDPFTHSLLHFDDRETQRRLIAKGLTPK